MVADTIFFVFLLKINDLCKYHFGYFKKIGSSTSHISIKSAAKLQKINDLRIVFSQNPKSPAIFFADFHKSPRFSYFNVFRFISVFVVFS